MTGTITYSSASNTITCLGGTAGAPITFQDIVNANDAGGWRVVDALGTSQFAFNCKIIIGDGSTPTYFVDTFKQILMNAGFIAAGARFIEIKSQGHFTLGAIQSAPTKQTRSGCQLISLEATNYYYYIYDSGGTHDTNLYSCSINPAGSDKCIVRCFTIWNFQTMNYGFADIECMGGDYFNIFGSYVEHGILTGTAGGTYNQISQVGGVTPLRLYGNVDATVNNVYARGCQYAFKADTVTVAHTFHVVNLDTDTWATNWNNANSAIVYRDYTFDLITDVSAVVTLKKADGSTAFSVTSDAGTGAIATQTVTRGYYNQANGNTLQDYGPFTLTITKAGKMAYTQTGIILSAKIGWLIQLRDQLSGAAVVGDVAATKTFYKDDADSKLTGTLVLTGDAVAGDVKVGKKFYKDSLTTQLTGSLDQSDATAAEGDLIAGKTAYVNFLKKTGTFNPVVGGGPATVTVVKADPEEVVFVDGKPVLLIDEKDPEIYSFINKKKPINNYFLPV